VTEPAPPTITAVVCTRDRPEHLASCLPSLAAAVAAAPGSALVVVEQGRTGSAGELVARLAVPATVVEDAGRGVSRARNLGWRAATSALVAFTDDDCVVPVTWLADHQRALAVDASLVAACGAVVGLPRHGGRPSERFDPIVAPQRHRRGALPWDIGHGSNLAARVVALEAVGGFDERLGPGGGGVEAGEDADLLVRLLEVGDVLSGIGDAVAHDEWRDGSEVAASLRAYERGAGAWIGAQARRHPRDAARSVRRRLRLQQQSSQGDRRLHAALLGSFAVGLLRGARLRRDR
jgi:glycosyltransferase involved in cell wall biosynthesis